MSVRGACLYPWVKCEDGVENEDGAECEDGGECGAECEAECVDGGEGHAPCTAPEGCGACLYP